MPQPFDVIFGAAHTFDLPFVFGNFGPSLYARISFTSGNAPGRLALSRLMMQSIGAFAARGDPRGQGVAVPWGRWPQMRVFDADPERAILGTARR